MSQLQTAFEDQHTLPPRETWPAILYSSYDTTFSGSLFLRPRHGGAAQTAWMVGGRNILSWCFICQPDAHAGASLNIHVGPTQEVNPATSTFFWRSYALFCGDTAGLGANTMFGLRVPGLYAYFELVTAEINFQITGWLKLETP